MASHQSFTVTTAYLASTVGILPGDRTSRRSTRTFGDRETGFWHVPQYCVGSLGDDHSLSKRLPLPPHHSVLRKSLEGVPYFLVVILRWGSAVIAYLSRSCENLAYHVTIKCMCTRSSRSSCQRNLASCWMMHRSTLTSTEIRCIRYKIGTE